MNLRPFMIVAGLSIVACAGTQPTTTATATASAASNPPSTSASASSEIGIPPTPEMTDFMDGLKGSAKDVEASFKKHAKPGTSDANMSKLDLKDPKIVESEKNGTKDCYGLRAVAAGKPHEYEVCWEGTQIVSVEEKAERD
jgi:hypothetical protein